MARIIIGTWMVRYPLGGNLSWNLQWILGLHRLGHEVYLVEKATRPDECFDLSRSVMSDDCTYGVQRVAELLASFEINDCWCFVDRAGNWHGMQSKKVEALFRGADLYLDIGSHGTWLEEAQSAHLRVRVDGEPGATQIRILDRARAGFAVPQFDVNYSNGANLAEGKSHSPDAGITWRAIYNPVVTDLFPLSRHKPDGAYTTIMNWQSHKRVQFEGRSYGQKDLEFDKFIDVPHRSRVPMEVAVNGTSVPRERLAAHGWTVASGFKATASYQSFLNYILCSTGEFSVCKNIYVALHTGWFSDRSAAYLAAGRPVILQDTGFSEHLPCGKGLIAVQSADEAAEAIREVESDWETHSRSARRIAEEHLDAGVILSRFLKDLNIQ